MQVNRWTNHCRCHLADSDRFHRLRRRHHFYHHHVIHTAMLDAARSSQYRFYLENLLHRASSSAAAFFVFLNFLRLVILDTLCKVTTFVRERCLTSRCALLLLLSHDPFLFMLFSAPRNYLAGCFCYLPK